MKKTFAITVLLLLGAALFVHSASAQTSPRPRPIIIVTPPQPNPQPIQSAQ